LDHCPLRLREDEADEVKAETRASYIQVLVNTQMKD